MNGTSCYKSELLDLLDVGTLVTHHLLSHLEAPGSELSRPHLLPAVTLPLAGRFFSDWLYTYNLNDNNTCSKSDESANVPVWQLQLPQCLSIKQPTPLCVISYSVLVHIIFYLHVYRLLALFLICIFVFYYICCIVGGAQVRRISLPFLRSCWVLWVYMPFLVFSVSSSSMFPHCPPASHSS